MSGGDLKASGGSSASMHEPTESLQIMGKDPKKKVSSTKTGQNLQREYSEKISFILLTIAKLAINDVHTYPQPSSKPTPSGPSTGRKNVASTHPTARKDKPSQPSTSKKDNSSSSVKPTNKRSSTNQPSPANKRKNTDIHKSLKGIDSKLANTILDEIIDE